MLEKLRVEYLSVDSLIPYINNARTHSESQVAQIAASIREFGFTNPVLVDGQRGLIAGHGRVLAARKLGLDDVPVIELAHMTEAQKRAYILADNKLALNAGWDTELLALELGELRDDGFDLDLIGFNGDELAELLPLEGAGEGSGGDESGGDGSLAARFMVAPFSVLNAREGWWQSRKNAWIGIGIRSELGRGDNALGFSDTAKIPARKGGKTDAEKSNYGKCLETGIGEKYGREEMNGTSIFDPVLCELAYRWFSPPGGTIIDPFAGGSVRGIVASKLGRQYVGGDLRAEQVEANRSQGDELCADDQFPPVWHCGDSRHIDQTCKGVQADFVFSCPPYADLEVYSDNPDDLSTLAYAEFRAAYFEIIKRACSLLKQDRFAAFVVGEVRDKRGAYYDFVGDTVQAFRDAGLDYYNEAILITMVGSLPIRAGKQFSVSRKLGKTHQNILVFCKGDPKKAVAACGDVEVGEDLFPEAGDEG
jgi:hypothetical protein